MKKKVLFYSSVKNLDDFNSSQFYSIDIKILLDIGYEVEITNKIHRFFKFWDYQIAFIYFFRMGFFGGFIAKIFNKKIFFTGGIDNLSSDFASPKQVMFQRIFFVLCYWISTKCIIVSGSDLANINKFWNKNTKLCVVPHGIYTKQFNPIYPKQNIITSICWMGSIENVKRKGLDQLIRGFSIFKQRHPSFVLHLIGRNGPGSDFLQQIVEECNISSSVFFCGSISEKEKIAVLSKSKYYGQLSKFEGFGLAAIEAMASGCILIHSARGGLKETIKDYGAIVKEIDNPNAISEVLKKCESESNKYKKLSAKGREHICSQYDYLNRLDDFIDIISK